MFKNYKFYGPYNIGKGRLALQLKKGKSVINMSYPKYLMCIELNRRLTDDETVDHINGDYTDNRIENLQVLKRSEHSKLDVLRLDEQSFVCPTCKKDFKLSGKKLSTYLRNARRRKQNGPFCSKSCVGEYGKLVQLNQLPKNYTKVTKATYSDLKGIRKK